MTTYQIMTLKGNKFIDDHLPDNNTLPYPNKLIVS